MPGSSFGGFTEGLSSSIDRQRQDARHEEDKRSAREANILQLLAEHGTPEIQSMALQGLIQSANPKKWKKGLGGYLGEYEPNPAVGQIHSLLSTPETATRQVAADPDAHTTPMVPQAGPPPMPGQNPEETAQPLQYHATPPPTMTESYQRPRQALMEPQEERVIGEYKGLVQAYGGGPEAEAQARASIQEHYKRAYGHGGAGSGRLMKGKVIPDPNSQTGFSEILLHPQTGQEIARSPAMDPTKAGKAGTGRHIDLGDAFEIAARHEGFEDGASVTDPADVDRVMQVAKLYKADTAGEVKTAQGVAAANIPLSTNELHAEYSRLTDAWHKISAPARVMTQQHSLMEVGLKRFKEGDRVGGSEAVIATFKKILDPQTGVKEAEYDRTGASLGLLQRIQGLYERHIGNVDPNTGKWIGGGAGIPEAELTEMVETGRQLVERIKTINDDEKQRILDYTKEFPQLKPELILGREEVQRMRAPGGGTPPPAAPGTSTGPPAGPSPQGASGKTVTEAKLKARAAALHVDPDVLRQELVTKGGYTIVP